MIATVLIYLDMCCLKRPFDDQTQPRIRLETEAILSVMSMEPDQIRFVRSSALLLQNRSNPVPERAARVETWIRSASLWTAVNYPALHLRIDELQSIGLKAFDALHLASAEMAGAQLFVTVDDRLLSAAARRQNDHGTVVSSPVDCAKELNR